MFTQLKFEFIQLHVLKFLCIFDYFPRRYRRKWKWVFLIETLWLYGMCMLSLMQVVCVHTSWLVIVGLVRRVVTFIRRVMLVQLLVQLVLLLGKNHRDSSLSMTEVVIWAAWFVVELLHHLWWCVVNCNSPLQSDDYFVMMMMMMSDVDDVIMSLWLCIVQ